MVKFKRNCKRCGKLFLPNTRSHKFCYDCIYEASKNRKWKNKKKIVKNVKK